MWVFGLIFNQWGRGLKVSSSTHQSSYQTMPPTRNSSGGSFRENSVDFNVHCFRSTRNSSAPYPSLNDMYARSSDPNNKDSFDDLGDIKARFGFDPKLTVYILGLHDLINASKRVSRCKLERIETNEYLSGLLSRGVQASLDRWEPHDRVIEAAIGYSGSVGTAILVEMVDVNAKVGELSLSGL